LTIILGLNAYHGDASARLLRDSVLVVWQRRRLVPRSHGVGLARARQPLDY
jgi:hypothetical protein